MYALWVKVDETLPWLELEGSYETEGAAKKAVKGLFCKRAVKIVRIKCKNNHEAEIKEGITLSKATAESNYFAQH
ncbi:MAG: hypothetical protein QXW82_01465 [Candidatus Bathyarchaeia archaeon]